MSIQGSQRVIAHDEVDGVVRRARRRGASILAAIALIVSTLALAQSAQAAAPAPASNTHCESLADMEAAGTANGTQVIDLSISEFDGLDPVTNAETTMPPTAGGFTYLVNLDNSGDPFNEVDTLRPGVHAMASNSPIVDAGTVADRVAGSATLTLAEGCRYLVSVRADGYKLGGEHIRIETDGTVRTEAGGSGPTGNAVEVVLVSDQVNYDSDTNQPGAACTPGDPDCGLPLSDVTVNVFEDSALLDAQINAGEPGLAGFQIEIGDGSGEVTVDFFGDPICGGDCTSDANGAVVIENLPAGFYDINVIPPLGTDWVQTTTIEGTHNIEAVLTENYNSAAISDSNFLVDPALRTFFNFGFTSPTLAGNPYTPDAGGGNISGAIFNDALWHPAETEVIEDGTNFSGIIEPVANAWVGLNDISLLVDEQVALQQANADGEFLFENVPAGTYQLVYFDPDLFYIIGFRNVTVAPNTNVDMGSLGAFGWFGQVNGYVFVDDGIAKNGTPIAGLAADGTERAGNGVRDCIGDTGAGFVYWGNSGLVDHNTCETGLPNTEVLLRDRDGSVWAGGVTDATGRYEFPDILGPVFEALVLEVSAGTLDFTGHSVHQELDMNERYTQGECEPGGNADLCLPADAGGGLLLAQITFASHRSEVDFGKLPYSNPAAPNYAGPNDEGLDGGFGSGNGGIAGGVIYGTTRNEFAANLQAFEDYEPGIPDVSVNVYAFDPACGDATYGPDLGIPGDDGDCLTDLDGNIGVPIDAITTDHYKQPTGCDIRTPNNVVQPDLSPFGVDTNCIELPQIGNETKDGAWDGGFAFGDLPPGKYIVEVVPPANYQVLKENDLNVAEGNNLVPEFPPAPCVGEYHFAQLPDDYSSPFDAYLDSGAYNGGEAVRLCNRRLLTVAPSLNAAVDIFLLPTDDPFVPNANPATLAPLDDPFVTSSWESAETVPLPGRVYGLVLNDLVLETDPTNIRFGDNKGAVNVPIGIYDFTGRQITTVWTDEHGFFEVLLPSTFSADSPIPGGVTPGTYLFVANDVGRDAEPNLGYNPQALSEPFPLDVWPGKMTKADMPIIPIAQAVCNVEADSPVLFSISAVVGTPGGGETLTVLGTGFQNIANLDPVVTITDDTGMVVATPALDSFIPAPGGPGSGQTEDTITFTAPALTAGIYQIDISSPQGGDSARNGISYHVRGTGYNPPVVNVTGTIQDAIDGAAPGSLIVVPTGQWQESVIVHKAVTVQGFGPGGNIGAPRLGEFVDPGELNWNHVAGSTIEPRFGAVDPVRQNAWNLSKPATYGPNQNVSGGAGFTLLLAPGEDGVRIDGFGVTGGRGSAGGGIAVNGNAVNAVFSNNVLENNSASRGGGGITLGVHSSVHSGDFGGVDVNNNTNVTIRDNRILGNGGVFSAGGVGIFNDADGYTIEGNAVCGNFSAEYGGGISHFGESPGGSITDNVVLYNGAFDEGGGILIGGESTALDLGDGSGAVTIERNLIQSNLSNDDGGGIMLLNPLNDQVDIVNNFIVNNGATDAGGGIALDNAANVSIVNNTIAENVATSTAEDADFTSCGTSSCPRAAGVFSTEFGGGWTPAATGGKSNDFADPEMHDNIFWENEAYVWDSTVVGTDKLVFDGFIDMEVREVAEVDTNDTDAGDFALSPTHSILSQGYPTATQYPGPHPDTDATNTVGEALFNRAPGGPDDPWFVNELHVSPTGQQAITGGNQFITIELHQPRVSVLETTDYHLQDISMAIDLPPNSGDAAADDIDGDTRDATPDRGADEFAPGDVFYISTLGNVNPPGPNNTFRDEDIIAIDPNGPSMSMFFDGSANGLPGNADIDAFHVVDGDTILMSFNRNAGVTLPTGAIAQDEDVVKFDAGEWSIIFVGAEWGLGDTNGEDIDALYMTAEGDFVISTVGTARVDSVIQPAEGTSSVLVSRDEDMLHFEAEEGQPFEGNIVGGKWTRYFDGTDVGLGGAGQGGEDINAVAIDETTGNMLFSVVGNGTPAATTSSGFEMQDEDIGSCNQLNSGGNTSCDGAPPFSMFFDGSASGLLSETVNAHDIDGISR